jgi:hypothetical protein
VRYGARGRHLLVARVVLVEQFLLSVEPKRFDQRHRLFRHELVHDGAVLFVEADRLVGFDLHGMAP